MLPLDAVLTGALVVALDLALATWPAGGAWRGGVSSVAHDGEWEVRGVGRPNTRTGGRSGIGDGTGDGMGDGSTAHTYRNAPCGGSG